MSLSEDLREFAGVVELLEEHGVEVQGARSIQTDVEGELIRGELTVLVATDTEISVDATATVTDDDVDPDDPLEDDVQADDDRDDRDGVPCPECDRTFDDVRAMKNHRARAHEGGGLDVGDSELWCGICQKGPMTDHGLKSHHGRMHGGEDLDPVTDPPEEWLDEDDDVPLHHDHGRLREAYEAADGVIADTAEQLDVDVTTGAVRYQLIQHGIHDPDGDQDAGDDEDQEDFEDDVDEENVATEDEADPQPVVTNGGGSGFRAQVRLRLRRRHRRRPGRRRRRSRRPARGPRRGGGGPGRRDRRRPERPPRPAGVERQSRRRDGTDRGGRPPGEALDRLPAGRRGRGTPRCPGGERVA